MQVYLERSFAAPSQHRGIVQRFLFEHEMLHRLALALWQFLERTRAGLHVRAVSQNAEMVHALGTDVRTVRTSVFAFGCAMAMMSSSQ